MSVIPIYLYRNNQNSLLTYSRTSLPILETLYVIQPDFRPFPRGTVLICAKNVNQVTVSVDVVYDVYDMEAMKDCESFIAWLEPVPNSVPIYVFTDETQATSDLTANPVYISLEKTPPARFKSARITPFYTIDARKFGRSLDRLNPSDFGPSSLSELNRFLCNQERCLPDPKGVPLSECVVDCTKRITDLNAHYRPSLLHDLETRYGKRNPILENINPLWATALAIAFMLVVLIASW